MSGELKMHLKASHEFSQSHIGQQTLLSVQIINYQNKDYIGFELDQTVLSLQELVAMKQQLEEKLCQYCPELSVKAIQPELFSQIFIA